MSFFGAARWQLLEPSHIPIPFAPDIVVEVLSAWELAVSVNRKISEYLDSGSQEVWIIDPANQTMMIHTREGARILKAGDSLTSPVLPGFSMRIAELLTLPQ